MKTLRDASVQGEVRSRIESLTAEDAARWGKMSVHQMICHLRDSYGVGLGEKKVAMVAIPMPRAFMKRVALQVPIEWRKGSIRTRGGAGCGRRGPVEFENDRAGLLVSGGAILRSVAGAVPASSIFWRHDRR